MKETIDEKKELQTIDCSRIETGMVIKNYNAMCDVLNEKPSTGKSKQLQLSRWKCFFDFDKDGQKFIIGEIFKTPLPSVDARKLKDTIYVKYIELLLMEYLSRQKGHVASLTKKDLYRLLGMTNLKYRSKSTNFETIKNGIGSNYLYPASEEDIQIFYQRADKKLNSILSSALRSMANRFLIKYSTEYVVSDNEIKYDVRGNEIVKSRFRIADDQEVRKILKAQQTVLWQMGYICFSDVFLHNKMKEYFAALDEYVKDNYEWNFVYSQIKIIYLDDEIKRQLPIKAEEIRQLSLECKVEGLNQIVVDFLNVQAQKQYKYGQEETETVDEADETKLNRFEKVMYNSNFVAIQKQLADYLIKIDDAEREYINSRFSDSKAGVSA